MNGTLTPDQNIAMRTAPRLCALLFAVLSIGASAQAQDQSHAPIDFYIHSSWDTLSRSMSDCKSVVDTKVTTASVLYLPYGMPVPAAVKAMQSQCSVQIAFLPRAIHTMGDVRIADIPKEGLLYLPNPYIVPGGRFNEMYGWDSYFILLGLLQDHRVESARGIVENFFFEIENYGAILNANRTYYLTRSQPPLLSSMISEVYQRTHDTAWLARAYGFAGRDYSLWTTSPHLARNTSLPLRPGSNESPLRDELVRYSDLGEGPAPEMADDSAYFADVIRWLLAHPTQHPEYLVKASERPGTSETARLRTTSCDIRGSRVCAGAYAQGYRLSAAFFHGDRAMRESGFDTSFRFGPFSGSTDDYAPVCLNSLLYKYATDMAFFAHELGRQQDEDSWNAAAGNRKAAIDKYLWQPEKGLYFDYNVATRQSSTYHFISTFYPLWAGVASPAQAAAVQSHLALFEHRGGVAMSDNDSGVQWDYPYGWAPTNWFTVLGLERYGFKADAARIAQAFMKSVQANYQNDGTIREKYNVVSADADVKVAAGYKANVIGFGWTNGVYTSMEALLDSHKGVQTPPAIPGTATLLTAILLTKEQLETIVPATVFFRGKTATTQLRNSSGVRFPGDAMMFVTKVDTGGYASSIQDRYQDYLITEVPLNIGNRMLLPGAYGVGFLAENFIAMNLGGQEVLNAPAQIDATLKRPTPLQILPDPTMPGAFRLYSGRSFVQLFHPEHATTYPQ